MLRRRNRGVLRSWAQLAVGERLIGVVVRLVSVVLISAIFGSVAQGQYALMLATASLVSIIVTFGLEISSNALIPASTRTRVSQVIGNTLVAIGVMGLVGVGIVLLLAQVGLLGDVSGRFVAILSAGTIATVGWVLLGGLLFGLGAFRAHLWLSLVHHFIFMGSIGLSLVVAAPFDAILGGWVFGLTVAAMGAAVAVVTRGGCSIDRGTAARQLRLGLDGYGYSVSNVVSLRLDALVVNRMLGTSALGVYSIAFLAAEAVVLVPKALSNVLLVAVRRWDIDTTTTLNNLFGMVALFGLALAFVGTVAIPVFLGPEFTPAVLPLLLLVPGMVLFGVFIAGAWMSFGSAASRVPARAAAAAAVATVILDLTLIPLLRLPGAALASSLAYAVGFYVFFMGNPTMRVPVPSFTWLRRMVTR